MAIKKKKKGGLKARSDRWLKAQTLKFQNKEIISVKEEIEGQLNYVQ